MYYDWENDQLRYSDSEEDLYTNPLYKQINIRDDSFINQYLTPSRQNFNGQLNSSNINNRSESTKTTKKSIMDKLATCKKFSGYPNENGSKFLKEFESFVTLHELDQEDDDSKILAAFHLHLQGPALTWHNGLTSGLNWNAVKGRFTAKYVKFDWEHPSVVIENQLFNNMKLHPGQEIEDFYCKLVEKGELLCKPDHEIRSKFVDGLPDKLAFYVRASKPKDTAEALTLAKTGEAYKYRESENTVAAARNVPVNTEIEGLKCQLNQLTEMMKDLKTQKQTQIHTNSSPGFRKFPQNQTSNVPRRNFPCFNCNGVGHVKKYCNWNGTGNFSPQSTCQLCSQNGHVALQCRQFKQVKQGNQITSIKCQICTKAGHTAKECFQFQQENSSLLGATGHAPPGDHP